MGKRKSLATAEDVALIEIPEEDTINNVTRRACTYPRTFETRSLNHYCRGNTLSITHSECASVALVIQHAMRMCRVILSFLACPAIPYFSTLSHKRQYFRKECLCT